MGRSRRLTLALAALLSALAFHAPMLALAQQDPLPPLTPEQRSDLEYHAANLRAPSVTLAHRVQAARHLTRMRFPHANAILAEALRSTEADLVRAVIAALDAEPIVPFELLDALVHVSPRADEDRVRSLASIIGKLGERGGRDAAAAALNAANPVELRVGVVRVLGEMRNYSVVSAAVSALIELVDPARGDPEAVHAAALASLVQLTGNENFGSDPEQWRQWWDRARQQAPEDWLPEQMQRLEQQIEQLELDMLAMRRTNETFQRRLDETLNALYIRLAAESDQVVLPELAKWIRDDFAPVRRNAVQRADTRVLNGQPLSEEIHQALAERVRTDVEPEIRRRAARVLDRANVAGLSTLIASALSTETSVDCLRSYLDILAIRPNVDAVARLLELLSHNDVRSRAARTLLAHLEAGHVSESQMLEARQAARAMLLQNGAVDLEAARLLTRIADEEDFALLVPLLDHQDSATRRAAAEMLAPHATAEEQLMSRSTDPAIYPTAVELVSRGGQGWLATLDRLVAMPPPSASERDAWLSAVRRVCEQLPLPDLAAADQRIRVIRHEHIPAESIAPIREIALARAMTPQAEALPRTERGGLLVGLAQVRVALNRHTDALAALDLAAASLGTDSGGAGNGDSGGSTVNGGATSTENADPAAAALRAEVRGIRFRCLLALGQFDDAQQAESAPEPWIAALATAVNGGSTNAANALRAEIARRFPELQGGMLEEFNRLASILDGGNQQPEDAESSRNESRPSNENEQMDDGAASSDESRTGSGTRGQ